MRSTPVSSDAQSAVAAIDKMAALAKDEEWDAVQTTLSDLPQLVMRVPLNERPAILLAARSCVEAIRESVLSKSSETSTRLRAVKTGRQGAQQYQETSQLIQPA